MPVPVLRRIRDGNGGRVNELYRNGDGTRGASVRRTVFLIILIAFVLRVWGIWFGLPYLYQSDEPYEVLRALRLGMGQFDFSRTAKGGYFYLLFLEYGVYFVVLKLLNVVKSSLDFAYLFIREPWSFYLMGRITTAVIGTATVFFTYRLGAKTFGKTAGAAAAAFLAVDMLHVSNSHYATVDVPLAFTVTLSLFFAVRILESPRTGNYLGAALFTGLAAMTKLPGVLVCIPVFLAHFYAVRNGGGKIRDILFGKRFLFYGFLSAVVFLAGNPGFVVEFGKTLSGVLRIFGASGKPLTFVDTGELRPPPNRFLYYLNAFGTSLGWPLFAICVLGFLYAAWKRKKADVLFLSFLSVFFLVLALSKHPFLYYERYVIPLIPPLVILAARFLKETLERAAAGKAPAVLAAACTLLVLWPAVGSAWEDLRISFKDTRTYAKEWIEANIPEGSKILIEGSRTTVSRMTVPLRNSPENLRRSIELYKKTDPGKARYFELELKVLSGKTYDLVTVGPYRPFKGLEYYKRIGVRYMVLRPEVYKVHRRKKVLDEMMRKIARDPDVELMKRFEGDPFFRPGPTIEIYRIKGNGGEKGSG